MESSGWEIRPAVWVLLVVTALAAIYVVVISFQRFSNENRQKPA